MKSIKKSKIVDTMMTNKVIEDLNKKQLWREDLESKDGKIFLLERPNERKAK